MRTAALKMFAAVITVGSTLQIANAETALALDAPVLDWNSLQRFGVDPLQINTDANYHVSYKTHGKSMDGTIFDAKRFGEFGVFATNFSATPDPLSHSVTRLESSWTHPIDDGKRQLSLGDALSNSGGWGDTVRFGGMGFGSTEAPRSDLITTPRLRSFGEAVVPSVADLLIDRTHAAASSSQSQFVTTGLLRAAGPNQVSLQVSDALGRTQMITQPLVASTAFAAKGRSDYAIDIGRIREDFGIRSHQYGRWFASSVLRYGLNKDVTLNWRAAQLHGESGVMGIGVSSRIGALGVVSATVASSSSAQDDGWLARVGYEYADPSVKLMIRYRLQSRGYKDIGANTLVNPVRQRTLASVGLSMGNLGSLALVGASQTFADNDRGDIVAVSHQLPVKTFGVISTVVTYSATASNASALLISFTHRFVARNAARFVDLRQLVNIFETGSFIDALRNPVSTQHHPATALGIL